MPEEIEKLEPAEVVETVVEQPAAEEVKQWTVVDDKPEVHSSFLEQPKTEEEVIEKVIEQPIADEKPIEEKPIEQEVAPLVIDENVILKELNEKYGFDAKSLDDLKPKEIAKLDPEIEKYLEYKKETGRGYQDFLNVEKDWTAEPKINVLKELLKAEKPYLSDSDIELLIEDKYATEELSEFADESDKKANRLKEIALEDDYQKGLKLLESQKEKYKVVKGLDESIPEDFVKAKEFADSYLKQQEENKVAFEQTAKDFQSKTDEVFSSNFEGFKVKVGDEEFSINPENVEETKKTLSDLSNFDKKFFDESGKLKDAEGYYKALHFAMNPEKVAEHFIKIGMAKQLEIEEKESKNVQVQGVKSIQTGDQGKRWKVEEES
jgi:hypothetical protein